MLKVLKYSLGYSFRKKSTIILLALLFVLSVAIPLLAYYAGVLKTISYRYVKAEVFFTGMLSVALIPIFLMLISYIAVIVGQVFKRGEEDGTTLMLVSSRYTRSEVILGRFAAIVVHVIMVAFIFAVGMELSSLFYQPSAMKYEIISFLSMIVGCFFIGLIFSGISLIFAILMGRIGAIVTSVFLIVLFAVLSPILLLTTSNSVNPLNQLRAIERQNRSDVKVYVYDNPTQNKIESQELLYSTPVDQQGRTNLDIFSSSSYNSLAWVDVWTQLQQMLGMFGTKDSNPTALDKISAVDIKNSYFFKNDLQKIDPSSSTSADTTTYPNAKMVFELNSMFNKFYEGIDSGHSYGGSLYNSPESEIIQLQENFDALKKMVSEPQFQSMVNKFESIVKNINQIALKPKNQPSTGYNSYEYKSMTDVVASLVKIISEDSSLSSEITTPSHFTLQFDNQGYGSVNVTETAELIGTHPISNSQIKSYTAPAKLIDESRNDVQATLERMAIYYAIYKVDAKAVSDDKVQNQTTPSSTSQPVNNIGESMVYDDSFKGYFQLRENYYPGTVMTKADLENKYGNSFTSTPIVPPAFIYVFWPAVALGLFGLAFVLHRRADFK